MKINFFTESDGSLSMRRLLAFVFALASIGGGIMSIVKALPYQAICASFGIPSAVCIILLLFTTWEDIVSIINSLKK